MANKKVSNEQLARMIARGFNNSNKIFQQTIGKTEGRLNERIDKLDGKIDEVDDRVDEHREETRKGFKEVKEKIEEQKDDHYRLEARVIDVSRKQDLHDRKIKILEKN